MLEHGALHCHVEPALADVTPDGDGGINRSTRRGDEDRQLSGAERFEDATELGGRLLGDLT